LNSKKTGGHIMSCWFFGLGECVQPGWQCREVKCCIVMGLATISFGGLVNGVIAFLLNKGKEIMVQALNFSFSRAT